ncbi:MAG: hypothetical protein ACTSPM_03020 [Candidatus Heimdallarchaeota archaeon]
MSPKKVKKKLSRGTKENITQIIDELSIIIGRRNWPKEGAREAITASLQDTDTHIAAVSLNVPEIDLTWDSRGAKVALTKIRKKRQWVIRSLFGTTIFGSLLIVIGTIAAIIFMDHWAKWLILGGAAIILLLGSASFPKMVIIPYIINYDKLIPIKFQSECKKIDDFVAELLKYIK